MEPIDKYKGSGVIFYDMLRARKKSQVDELFTSGRHEKLDVYYLNQDLFWFTKPKR